MSKGTCAWPGCDSTAIIARGLCGRDYRRAERAGRLDEFSVTVKVCDVCGVQFEAGKHGKRFCSTECREVAYINGLAERRESRRAARLGRRCIACGEEIPDSLRRDARFCSTECQQAAWYALNDEHCREAATAWRLAHPDERRDADHRRRARIAQTASEPIDLEALWIEQGEQCGICGDPIPAAAVFPDPLSKSIDHIVPLSRGGTHTRDNVQFAHLVCNERKGAKTPRQEVAA